MIKVYRLIEKITGGFWQYKGIRIRGYSAKSIKRIAIAIVFFTFSVPMILSFIFLPLMDESGKPDWFWIIGTALIYFVLGLVLLRVARQVFAVKYERLFHRQSLARLIESQGFKEIKSVKRGQRNVDKTVYYPKVYYSIENGLINVRFPLDSSKHQDKYLQLQKSLETSLNAELFDYTKDKGYVLYEFMYDMITQRISIEDVVCEKGRMKLMNNVYWEYDKLPHMLIGGGTGGGKTYFILTLIESLLQSDAELVIADPKRADLSDLKALQDHFVYDTKDGILMALRKFKEDMLAQTDVMKKMPNYKTGMNYADVGLPPHFFIFDEYVAFNEMLSDYKDKNAVEECMKQVSMLGRQAGYFLIIGCQRPDAKYFSDGIRDQFGFRVTLGKMYSIGYSMMFGDVDKVFINKKIKGRGYSNNGSEVVSEFYSPFVPCGHDFMGTIGALLQKRKEKGAVGSSEP